MSETCYECGNEYEHLGMHWRRGQCSYPEITSRQHEIIKGCLMGDGHLDFCNKSPKFHVSNTNREFLEWLENELSEIVSRVYLHATSEEQEQSLEKHNMGSSTCKDIFRLSTRTLPNLERYEHWYTEDGIHYPENLKLTPLSLKVWYCCDGTLREEGVQIGSKNEMDRGRYLKDLFRQFDVEPTISHWNMIFTKEQSERMFQIMGEPVPGMEDKWP